MTEHPTNQELEEYSRRVLAPADFLYVHRHVTACPRCAAQCNSPEQLARDLDYLQGALVSAPAETPYHLSAAEMVAYAKDTLDEIDLEIAESHLGICATCLSEIQQRAVKVQSRPRRWIGLPVINSWQPVRVAVAVLFGAVLILLTIWLLRSRSIQNKEIVGPANTSNPQSTAPADAQASNTPDNVAEFALVLTDGDRKVTLDEQGKLAGLERLPASVQQKIAVALQAGKLEQPADVAQLNSQPSTLLGESANGLPFRLIGPLGQVLRSQQPTFRWRALPGAQSYKVIVTDADLNEVETSVPLTTTEWRITKPLRRGVIYSWQVTALNDGVAITSPVLPAPQAKFKVMDSSTARMLQQAERVYPDSHLTLGVLYAEAGLPDEAKQKLRVLVRNNPQIRIAQKLLQSVQVMRNSSSGS